MSLSLTFRTGQDFYVGDTQFVVGAVVPHYSVMLHDKEGGSFCVVRHEYTDIGGGVRVRSSSPSRRDSFSVAINFDAPRDVLILRGPVFRRPWFVSTPQSFKQ